MPRGPELPDQPQHAVLRPVLPAQLAPHAGDHVGVRRQTLTPTDQEVFDSSPSLGVLLLIPYRHLENRVLAAVNAAGYAITLPQARIFQRIADAGSRLTQLAEAAQVTKQTAGYLVDQLERDGFVRRVPDPSDLRAKLITITERGRRCIDVAVPVQRQIEREWADHLGDQASRGLLEALIRLREITDPYA